MSGAVEMGNPERQATRLIGTVQELGLAISEKVKGALDKVVMSQWTYRVIPVVAAGIAYVLGDGDMRVVGGFSTVSCIIPLIMYLTYDGERK